MTSRSVAALVPDSLPRRDSLPSYLAPLPESVEDFALKMALPIVIINALGTAFGFWYYGFHPLPLSDPLIVWQLAGEPPSMWIFVPDSPVATMFIGIAFGLWWLGRPSEYWNAMAFFGCLKLGLWTPYVLAVFFDGFIASTSWPMYLFLFGSHLAMAVEAFVLYRFADFPIRAVAVAVLWYGFNDIVDYFVPIVGTPHHTLVPGQAAFRDAIGFTHPSPNHELAAVGAVVLTILATFLALAIRVKKVERQQS